MTWKGKWKLPNWIFSKVFYLLSVSKGAKPTIISLVNNCTCDEFVGQDAERPDIQLSLLGFPADDLGRNVVQSPAETVPSSSVVLSRPAEIAQFYHVLSLSQVTCESRRFSAFMSRCKMFLKCIYWRADIICFR